MAGGLVHLIEVARRWEHFDLTVFGPSNARAVFEKALPAARFVALPSCGLIRSRAVVFLLRAALAPFALLKLRTCDVLLAQSHFLPDVVPAVVFGGSNAAVEIWHVQEPPWHRPGSLLNNVLAFANERIGLFLVWLFLRTVIAGSRLVVQKTALLARKAVFVTTNGADHIVLPLSEHRGARAGALYVGRLHPTKGISDLISAWKIVVQKCGPQTLVIAGDGESAYVADLKRQIASLGLTECIQMAGPVCEQEKRALLVSVRAFAFPSYEEGWGIALAEAMAAGTPCVTYGLEIYEEVFPKGRLHAPLGDANAFAIQLVNLLSDDALNRKISREAMELGRSFRWRNAAEIEASALRSLPAASRTDIPSFPKNAVEE